MESHVGEVECCETIEDINNMFSKKISVIRECLDLRFVRDEDIMNSFIRIQTSIEEVEKVFKQIREVLKSGQAKLSEMKNLLMKLENINKRLNHLENNIPAVLKKVEAVAPQKEVKAEVSKSDSVVSNKIAKMKYVTLPEFEAVPSYMKGRIRYDQINKLVDEFNVALEGKYKLMLMPRKGMSVATLKVWKKLKAQENEETKGFFFCTADDLKEFGGIKIDKTTSNMLTILRHCSKMKEIRRPGPIIRYAVLS